MLDTSEISKIALKEWREEIGDDLWFHPKYTCLFEPKRYKVFYGGRLGLKSWSIARALVLLASQRPIRVLCAREFQKSIKESVHQLLESQIEKMGLADYYDIQRDSIKGRAGTSAEGTEFFFIGLHLNSQSVKSYEDVDICWIEEAANVSSSSWKYLTPTIRKPEGGPFGQGSEIWISFNPELDTDATWKLFVKRKRDNAFVVKTSYKDNPFVSDEMLQDIEADLLEDVDNYLHVWEGHCKQVLDGAVYAEEIRRAITEERFTNVPYDPNFPVGVVADLGYSDHTSLWFFQKVGFEWHIIDFYESNLKKWDHYLEVIQRRGVRDSTGKLQQAYLYNTIWLPHDATAQQLGSKMSIEEQTRVKFPNNTRIVPKMRIKDKINAARTVFPVCYFDEERCDEGIQHLKRYTFEVKVLADMTKKYSPKPKHDEHSDAASAFEYFAIISGIMPKSTEGVVSRLKKASDLRGGKLRERVAAGLGWMR